MEFGKLDPALAARKNLSDLSRLHNSDDRYGSESVVSFDSISTKSEVAFHQDQLPCDDRREAFSVGSPASRVSTRRGSCPSIVTGPKTVVVGDGSTLNPPRRVLSMSHVDIEEKPVVSLMRDSCKLSSAERRERLKLSLSRLSNSVASVVDSIASSRKEEKVVREFPQDSEISDILSPVSSIPQRDETIIGLPEPAGSHNQKAQKSTIQVMRPPPGPSAGFVSDLGSYKAPTTVPQFSPSPIGKHLMTIYGGDKPQEPMWTIFVLKSKSPLEFADSASRMPSIVFCLRGLIRFGNGDYGASRTDCLPHLINILLRRHPIADTPSLVEAVECCSAILAMLCVNPVSRQMSQLEPRKKFEPVMATQNGFLFQQLVTFLTACLPRYLEADRDLSIRAASSVLDIVFLYAMSPLLRSSWLTHAPPQFTQSLLQTLSDLGDKIPPLLSRCISILDVLLDHASLDGNACRQIAHCIRTAVSRAPSSQVAAEAGQLIRRWGQQTLPTSGARKRSGSISNFFRSLGGHRASAGHASIKSTIYAEYNHT